jgi:hypothetical protein
MVDTTITLPMPTSAAFDLAGIEWPLPSYDNVDDFTGGLEHEGLLSDDPVVRAALLGKNRASPAARPSATCPTSRA